MTELSIESFVTDESSLGKLKAGGAMLTTFCNLDSLTCGPAPGFTMRCSNEGSVLESSEVAC